MGALNDLNRDFTQSASQAWLNQRQARKSIEVNASMYIAVKARGIEHDIDWSPFKFLFVQESYVPVFLPRPNQLACRFIHWNAFAYRIKIGDAPTIFRSDYVTPNPNICCRTAAVVSPKAVKNRATASYGHAERVPLKNHISPILGELVARGLEGSFGEGGGSPKEKQRYNTYDYSKGSKDNHPPSGVRHTRLLQQILVRYVKTRQVAYMLMGIAVGAAVVTGALGSSLLFSDDDRRSRIGFWVLVFGTLVSCLFAGVGAGAALLT
jgi:hypothetical protein